MSVQLKCASPQNLVKFAQIRTLQIKPTKRYVRIELVGYKNLEIV